MQESHKATVWMMPDFRRDNPYQRLLADGIQSSSTWKVVFYNHYKRGLPLSRGVSQLEEHPDLLHLHWLNPYQKGKGYFLQLFYQQKMLADLALLKARGIPYVWTFHNLLSHDTPYPGLEKQFFRKLALRSQAVLLHQESAADQFRELFPEAGDKARVIPHGHYRDHYGPRIDKESARRQLGLPEDGRLILFFGMIRPYKGLETLLNSWQGLGDRTSGSRLLIAGSPQDAEFARSIREQVKSCDSIILHDRFVPDESVPAYFSAADAAVFPFQKILTSGSVILALSYELPVIAPDFPTIRETVQPLTTGLYEAGNANALTARIQQACEGQLPVAGNSLELVRDRLDWEKIGKATAELYSRVSGRG
jgi:glycosyltransferase involved in cell wall biosynthesis